MPAWGLVHVFDTTINYVSMDNKAMFRYRIYATGFVTVSIWLLLAWEYFHRGIPSHHLFADPKLPSVSNAWGGVVLPLLTAYLLYRIQKRIEAYSEVAVRDATLRKIMCSLCLATSFGLTLAVSFTFDYSSVSELVFFAILVLALIFPIYRAEFYLGFVLALTYFFGAVLPTFIGGVVVLISATANFGIHPLIFKLKNKFEMKQR